MSLLTYKWAAIKGRYHIEVEKGGNLEIGHNCKIGKNVTIIVREGAYLSIGDNCRIDENSYLVIGGRAIIGNNCSFAHDLEMRVPRRTKLTIGDKAMFSYNVCVRTNDGHLIYEEDTLRTISHNRNCRINLEEHVWVGMNCCILYGADIGTNSVIGAAALVKGKIPPNSLVVGNPGKIIRNNINWDIDPDRKMKKK